jgi:hypothetical protein
MVYTLKWSLNHSVQLEFPQFSIYDYVMGEE